MAGKGVSGAKGAIDGANGLPHLGGANRGPQRHIARSQTLGDRHEIGFNAIMRQRPPRAGAARATHYLVCDHQDAVAVADRAHQRRVAFWCRHTAPSGPDHGFKDKGGNRLGPRGKNGGLKLGCAAFGQCALACNRAIVIGGREFDRGDKGPLIGAGALFKARNPQRAQRVAMPRPLPRNEPAPRFLPNRGLILQGDLQTAFHRL